MNRFYYGKPLDNYVVLDLETTGLSQYKNHIIEVGMIKVRNNFITDTFDRFINPREPISAFITKLTGISNKDVENAPYFQEIEDDILKFLGNDVIIGHNVNFDLGFLRTHFSKEFSNKCLDTVYLSKRAFPHLNHYRLSDLTEYFHLYQNTHRAIDDCKATKELYDVIKKSFQ